MHNGTTNYFPVEDFMARTPIAPDGRRIRTSVVLPEDTHLQIQAMADANQVSAAWVIRMAVQRFLEDNQGQLNLPLRPPYGKEF
ncbi:CopG family transcriptional regulator [Massilia sp. DD77]|uniref:ribbon-helix-helix domain-containing protein n=1 Tax=Massilia sp. DD77 TaxID=3109349 RepID=UPI002FFF3B6C